MRCSIVWERKVLEKQGGEEKSIALRVIEEDALEVQLPNSS